MQVKNGENENGDASLFVWISIDLTDVEKANRGASPFSIRVTRIKTGLGRSNAMTYIITEPCIHVKDATCIEVCPVDCIHPRKDEPEFADAAQLYINPDECIDCGACVPVCPVAAIFPEAEVPKKWKRFIQVNYGHWGE